ncbi:meiotic forkhead transcription factor Mei4 [Schizosaccharomyces japonicus yFS275]|uniref:Meiotic forkhead transcription factor Mei4 n=1 Tax=Schizosaccharomyces japonicus (strain yFS275 / FY16936) TaxID=402676 RepID=B6K377_SCHJY|nr:meiotic forkhead transcription factor Mei4 [Schizosaccharomyces japonicus yFS275]EEB07934.1 meiotic forkhead transcription factor Mei4 [Schizosaccharomyces japonicus yFS275]
MEPTLSDIELLSPLCDFNNGILRNPDETSHDRHDQVSISSTLDVSKTVSIQATQLLNCSPLACQDTSIVLPELEDDGTRPSFSFSALIAMALVSSPERKLSLRDICAWIRDKFTYYRDNESNWSNSIRHNLSLNKAFIKIAKPKEKTGKGHYWTVDPAYVNSLFSATTGSVTRGRTNPLPHCTSTVTSTSTTSSSSIPSSYHSDHVPTPAEILEQAASSASTESPGPTIQSLPSSPYSRTVLPTDYPGEQGSMRENSWNASSTPPVLDETVCLEDGVPQTLNTVRSPDGLSRDYHRNLSLSSSEYLPVSSESPNTALRIHREKVRATLCPSDLYRSPQTPDPWIPQVSQTHLAAVTESSSVKPQSLFQAIVNATCFGSPDMLEARRVAERRSLICGLYAHELREDDNSLLGKVDAFAVDLVGIVTRETYRARLLQSSPKSAKPDLNVYF